MSTKIGARPTAAPTMNRTLHPTMATYHQATDGSPCWSTITAYSSRYAVAQTAVAAAR
jgi:hypothetical protein